MDGDEVLIHNSFNMFSYLFFFELGEGFVKFFDDKVNFFSIFVTTELLTLHHNFQGVLLKIFLVNNQNNIPHVVLFS